MSENLNASPIIDLRSDTVTQPTDEMRAAMAAAPVGDDVYLEDPTINRLQDLAAERTGKEAALFMPSGSMGNLIAVKCHTQHGDQVVLQADAHILRYEMGGMCWFSGTVPVTLPGERGILTPHEVESVLSTDGPYYALRTRLICVEDSHNYGGGSLYPLENLAGIRGVADRAGLPVHMDGARVFNAAVAGGVPVDRITQYADSVMFSLSKGLSAPVGSMLCGTREFIEKARRVRRVVGGGMRQAGVLAAAGIVALETMVERLAEDHARAADLARGLLEFPQLNVDPQPQTNIVACRPAGGAGFCRPVVAGLKERGVWVSQLTPETIRLVTHRHIGYNEVSRALKAIREVLAGLP
jgi:threonine aldolase